jgi:HlyD family secretion protein
MTMGNTADGNGLPARQRWRTPALLVAVVLALTVLIVFATGVLHRSLPVGLLQVNGRIEGDRIVVASKFAGRVQRLLVREGEQVTAGQLLVTLDDQQAGARVRQASSSVTALAGQVRAAQNTQAQADRDAQRARELRATGMTTERDAERAQLAASVAHDQVHSLQAQLAQARATLDEARSVFGDLQIRAPSAGTVVTRSADLGEVVMPGAPLLTLVDLDRLYLQVYIPEVDIGRVHRGLPAQVYIDAFPTQPFAAELRYIAAQAEFTPREVQTRDERVKQVYAARLYFLANPQHRLTPGLPADAIIRWKDDAPWAMPIW